MSFFSVFSDIHRNRQNFKEWEQNQSDEDAKRKKYFTQHKPTQKQLKEADEFGRVVIDAVDLMDSHSENKAESVELAFEQTKSLLSMGALIGLFALFGKKLNKAENSFYKKASAVDKQIIEKFDENKRKKLKEEKLIGEYNFSKKRIFNKTNWKKLPKDMQEKLGNIITEDMLKQNKKIKGLQKKAFIVPLVGTFAVNSIASLIGTVAQIKASRVARYQGRDQLKDPMNFVEYTDEQKAKAKEAAKLINIPDEKKSGAMKDIIGLLKDYKNYEHESKQLDGVALSDIPEKDINKAYAKQKVLNKAIKKINNQAEEYSENMETASSVILGSSVLGGFVFGKLADWITKKGKKAAEKASEASQSVKSGKSNTLKVIVDGMSKHKGATGSALASIIAMPFAMQLQKDAARAGRYRAKRELEEDKTNFIHVPEKELNKIQAKGKTKKEGFMDIIKFIPEAFKTMKEYKEYKETELKDRKAMSEALKRSQISDQQMQDAKALQMRVFKSFDTIDDYSQQYGEDMEAACEIGEDAVGTIIPLAASVPVAIAAAKPHKAANFITGVAGGVFKKMGKFTKKYTSNLGQNWISRLDKKIKRNYDFKQIAPFEKDFDKFLKELDNQKASKMLEKLKSKLKEKLGTHESKNITENLNSFRKHLIAQDTDKLTKQNLGISEGLKLFSNALKGAKPDELRKSFDSLLQDYGVDNADFSKLSDKKIEKIRNNITNVLDNVPDEELQKSIQEQEKFFKENPTKAFIAKTEKINLKGKELYLTKDIKPIAVALVGAWAVGTLSLTYGIQSWFASLQKKAGRLGTMSAINELNQENEKFKQQNKDKTQFQSNKDKQKTLSYFDLVKAKRA